MARGHTIRWGLRATGLWLFDEDDIFREYAAAKTAFGAALALSWAVGGARRVEFPAPSRDLMRLAKVHPDGAANASTTAATVASTI
jgi:hypothetical protein